MGNKKAVDFESHLGGEMCVCVLFHIKQFLNFY